MRIAVLVKETPDTYGERRMDPASGRVDRSASDAVLDEISERALEVALKLKDADKQVEVVAITSALADATASLRKALAMGATAAVHVCDEAIAGSDVLRTSRALAAALQAGNYDLILAGNESTDGRGGVMPAMLAERLGLPSVTFVDDVDINGGQVTGTRSTEDGTMVISAPLPAIVSVTERTPEARFPGFKGTMTAKRKPLDVLDLASLGLRELGPSLSEVTAVSARPARSAGPRIVDEGDAGEQLADFLASRHLI